MIVKLLPLLLLTLKTSRCSLIIDKAYQKGLYLSDYCPNMKYCREGAHTMCVHYDPNNVIGPRCYNSVNVSITAEIANQVLEISNSVRSKIAKGVETGKGGVLLPRGYGIFRLQWDSELATIAQVLANQCVLRHDMCRATKKFPHPSQVVGLVRFRFPDWLPMSTKIKPTKGLTDEKMLYAVTQCMKTWYGYKSAVTEDMVKVYPNWNAPPYDQTGRLYLDMIHGPATHMGCGLSGYSQYVYYDNDYQGMYNSLHVVCNFSSGARKGTNTYETEPPIPGQGFSAKCGCPPGSKEDADCLCSEAAPKPHDIKPQPTCPLGETSSYCDPALVLLPIFTIEDAPPEKLYQFAEETKDPLKNYILQRIDNTSEAVSVRDRFKAAAPVQSSTDTFDIFNEKDAENVILQDAHEPSSAQSTAPPYYKKDNTSDAIFGRSGFKLRARALTSKELFEKGRENVLSSQHANKPTSVEIPAPSFNKEQQSTPQFRSALDSKPPPLPAPPPRRSPALRPSTPTRPHSRPRPPLPLPPPPRIPPPPPPRVEQYSTALQTHDDPRPAKPASQDRRNRPPPKLPPKRHQVKKKASIFTRVAQFQLPERRSASTFKVLKKDVEPRKDFSNLNQVVNDYLKRHPGYRIINGNNEQTQATIDIKPHAEEKAQTEAVASETGLNRVEETVIKFDQYLGKKNNSYYNNDVDIKDDNDNKLLSLLDNLEREVKHIALDGDEKQLFDAKIRKIYGSIVGRTALQKFPKSILFSTPDPEAAEIDFGETKSREKLEPNQVESDNFKNLNEPKQMKRFKVDQRIDRVKHPSPSVQGHKWKNKLIDRFDKNKYNPNVSNNGDRKPSGRYDHKYNDNHLENTYDDVEHQRMDELDHKYNDNLNKKYNENHLDHEYNKVPRKFKENFDHPHDYDTDQKYNDDELAAGRNKMKYQAGRAVFREFEHNSLGSHEDITPRNYENTKTNKGSPNIPLITKDRDKRTRIEKKHRKRVKSLGARNDGDILSLERRKYYQEKLDNIRRKLRGRKNWRNNDSKDERSLRRMHMKNRDSSRMRSKDQADNFYMPERARFLHGF